VTRARQPKAQANIDGIVMDLTLSLADEAGRLPVRTGPGGALPKEEEEVLQLVPALKAMAEQLYTTGYSSLGSTAVSSCYESNRGLVERQCTAPEDDEWTCAQQCAPRAERAAQHLALVKSLEAVLGAQVEPQAEPQQEQSQVGENTPVAGAAACTQQQDSSSRAEEATGDVV
jgi:hypothetical protein